MAKTVFVVNGGGNDLAYDAFYSALKQWGRYQIVDSPSASEIVMAIRYVTEDGGTRVWSTTDFSTGNTQVHSREIRDPQLILTIFDSRSKEPLWSTVQHRRLARFGRNREKETVNAAERLADSLKERIGSQLNTTQQ